VAGQLETMRIGDVEVLVETIPVPGTEPVSLTSAGDKVMDAYQRAQDVIVGAAKSTVEVLGKLGTAARPDKIEVEFGLGFSMKGNVIVVSGSADATLKVKLTYDTAPPEDPAS
jgi:hypothetical protein